MNHSCPRVSVLMTAYNREEYIAAAIESVLASTLKDFELIIVDDCSSDNTNDIARSYERTDKRVKVFLNEENLGDYFNRNKAATHASGQYIKYLDADDVIYPHGLEVMVSAMENFPEAGFGLSAKPDDNRPYPVCISPHEIYIEHFYGFNHFDRAPGSAIISKAAFDAVGKFSGKQFIGDQELWIGLARTFKMVKFPLDLYWNRIHDGQQAKMEMKLGNEIAKRRENLTREAILHPHCPLSDSEKITIFRRLKSQKQKASLLRIAQKFK